MTPDRRSRGLSSLLDTGQAASQSTRAVVLPNPGGADSRTNGASGTRCAWLSLDEADNDPVRFVRYLWAAVATVAAENPSLLAGEAPSADPHDVVSEVATILAERPGPSVVVLDDYHLIEAPEVQKTVSILLDLLPARAQSRLDEASARGRNSMRSQLRGSAQLADRPRAPGPPALFRAGGRPRPDAGGGRRHEVAMLSSRVSSLPVTASRGQGWRGRRTSRPMRVGDAIVRAMVDSIASSVTDLVDERISAGWLAYS